MVKKKESIFDKLERGAKRTGGILGSGLDWYFGKDIPRNKRNRGDSMDFVFGSKESNPLADPYGRSRIPHRRRRIHHRKESSSSRGKVIIIKV